VAITQVFSFLVCLLLTYGALKFIRNESAMGNVTFLGIPAWIPEMILPGTFGLMSFRFALRFLRHLSMLWRGSRRQEEER
jgi:TRAP-type C4-dicarboxylate transport system permease small subunit